jgi:hypothetical protein
MLEIQLFTWYLLMAKMKCSTHFWKYAQDFFLLVHIILTSLPQNKLRNEQERKNKQKYKQIFKDAKLLHLAN